MAWSNADDLRHLMHDLREPLATFVNYVALLEGEELTAVAQSYVKAMRSQVERASAKLDEITRVLENGEGRSAQ